MRKELIKKSFWFALGEAAYITLVALFFFSMEKMFSGQPDQPPFGIIILLTLFVISAAVSGALVLGKPMLLYFEGKKREAVELFACILSWLVLFFAAFLAILIFQ
jgi:hypothetical protein